MKLIQGICTCLSSKWNWQNSLMNVKLWKIGIICRRAVVVIMKHKPTFISTEIKCFADISSLNWYSAMQIIIVCQMVRIHAVFRVLTSLIEFDSISIHNPNLHLQVAYNAQLISIICLYFINFPSLCLLFEHH